MASIDVGFERGFAILTATLSCIWPFASRALFRNEQDALDGIIVGCAPTARARLAAAIERRQVQPRFDTRGAFFVAASGLAVSAFGFFGVVSLALFGALFCALLTGMMAYLMTRVARARAGDADG